LGATLSGLIKKGQILRIMDTLSMDTLSMDTVWIHSVKSFLKYTSTIKHLGTSDLRVMSPLNSA